jgi:type IV pilus assembly protein PilV
MKPMPQTRNKIAGLTLIEVLITIVILAVGLLGMAAMQVVGIRSANGSGFRTQASLLANDIAERMRANPTAIDNNTFLDIDSADIDCSAPPATYCSAYFDGDAAVAAASCTSAQLATYDVNTWFCGEVNSGARTGGVAGSLPQSSAAIACTDADGADADACSIGSTHTITLSWVEPNTQRNGDATVEQSISIILQP